MELLESEKIEMEKKLALADNNYNQMLEESAQKKIELLIKEREKKLALADNNYNQMLEE